MVIYEFIKEKTDTFKNMAKINIAPREKHLFAGAKETEQVIYNWKRVSNKE